MLYDKAVRPLLFQIDSEDAHEMTLRLLSLAQRIPGGVGLLSRAVGTPPAGLETRVFGLRFPNPVGLAAGFDKDCRVTDILPSLHFGFIEVGSITLRPQPGNPKPRIFRLPEQHALINRLGFNSGGVDAAAPRLAARSSNDVPLGINLGLNADCSKEKAAEEYSETFKKLEPYGDYFVINVSSPNTPGLRSLQEQSRMENILTALQSVNPKRKPLLVKLSPDLSDEDLPGLIDAIRRLASGVIASNTTLSRDGVPASYQNVPGGLSGAPLKARSTELIQKIFRLTQGRLPIVGVGGILTGADAFEKIRAGASLVQIYTGLVYGGPRTAVRIQEELVELLSRSGFKAIQDAVGSESLGVRA